MKIDSEVFEDDISGVGREGLTLTEATDAVLDGTGREGVIFSWGAAAGITILALSGAGFGRSGVDLISAGAFGEQDIRGKSKRKTAVISIRFEFEKYPEDVFTLFISLPYCIFCLPVKNLPGPLSRLQPIHSQFPSGQFLL